MPVMDEFREEREALKNASFKKKMEHFFYYYKWHVIVTIAILIFIGTLAHDILTAKDSALYGVFINTYADQNAVAKMMTEVSTLLEIDTNEYTTDIDTTLTIDSTVIDQTSYTSQQKLMAYMTTGELDFIAADQTTLLNYASTDTFHDFRTILTPAQIETYEPFFFYADMEEVRKKDAEADNGNFDYVMREYNPADPTTCIDPIPVAIYINDCSKVNKICSFREDLVAMGFVANSQHLDNALFFLDYLFE